MEDPLQEPIPNELGSTKQEFHVFRINLKGGKQESYELDMPIAASVIALEYNASK